MLTQAKRHAASLTLAKKAVIPTGVPRRSIFGSKRKALLASVVVGEAVIDGEVECEADCEADNGSCVSVGVGDSDSDVDGECDGDGGCDGDGVGVDDIDTVGDGTTLLVPLALGDGVPEKSPKQDEGTAETLSKKRAQPELSNGFSSRMMELVLGIAAKMPVGRMLMKFARRSRKDMLLSAAKSAVGSPEGDR